MRLVQCQCHGRSSSAVTLSVTDSGVVFIQICLELSDAVQRLRSGGSRENISFINFPLTPLINRSPCNKWTTLSCLMHTCISPPFIRLCRLTHCITASDGMRLDDYEMSIGAKTYLPLHSKRVMLVWSSSSSEVPERKHTS